MKRCIKLLRMIGLLLAATVALPALHAEGPAYGGGVAHLRNGFTIAHCSRETRGTLVRLYLNDARTSYVEVPASQIESYAAQPELSEPPSSQPGPSGANAARNAPPAAPAGDAAAKLSSQDTHRLVREASKRHGVDMDFLASVIRQESGGNSQAVSPAGARGLMQLMPATAEQLGVQDSFDPEQNVDGGARYLRELLERYRGDAVRALAAYNAGPEAVDRYQGVPPYPETRNYVRSVVRDYNRKKKGRAASAANDPKRGSSQPHAATPINR